MVRHSPKLARRPKDSEVETKESPGPDKDTTRHERCYIGPSEQFSTYLIRLRSDREFIMRLLYASIVVGGGRAQLDVH